MSDLSPNERPTELEVGSGLLRELLSAHLLQSLDQGGRELRCNCGDTLIANTDHHNSRDPHTAHVADVLVGAGYMEVPSVNVSLVDAVAAKIDQRLPQRLTTGPGTALNNVQERAALETDGWPGARRVRARIIAQDVMAMLAGRGVGGEAMGEDDVFPNG
ncbi:hypothetical protein [Arthrobacter alpinus]|uniref:hypothetical protein n=1 Tax=Arthrobacter alpinus TaxID=656366 RepID=UPI0012FEACBE|nr:hypothetical protein [Arthrobacter alpinus]